MAYIPFEHPQSFPGQAIPGMIKGFHAWREHMRASRREREPKTPTAMVIAGADLPVDPLTLFRAPPGSLYVVRSAAPIVAPNTEGMRDQGLAAAVEFAIAILGVGDIVVLCNRGAPLVAALIGHADRVAALLGENLQAPAWFTLCEEPLARALRPSIAEDERPRVLAQDIVRASIENLMTYPIVVEAIMAGALGLQGWYLDEAARIICRLDPDADEFVAI